MRKTKRIVGAIYLGGALVVCGHSISRANLYQSSSVKGNSAISEKPRTKKLPTGSWGGQHISMEVSPRRTTIEYDCAHATIDQPIVLDRQGRFTVSGRQFSERGGPVREESNEGYPARFSGNVTGNTMSLKVENSTTRELIGNFTVVHGAPARLFKCK